jgi:hypothetical protein
VNLIAETMRVIPIIQVNQEGNKLSLTLGREYEVLGIEADMYRILTDETAAPWPSDPVLYEPDCFRIIDRTEPEFWQCTTGEDGERYCYPPEWSEVGFFEDYHDGLQPARSIFWEGVKQYYPDTWRERCGHS